MNSSPQFADDENSQSWRRWIAEKAERFLLYARQQARSEEDAQDILQESLAECWRRSGGSVPDTALVFATLRRRAIDFGRSADRRARREKWVAAEQGAWFEADFAASDTHRVLEEALRQLPPDLRETVSLRVWGDLTFPEIAEIMRVPVPTAASRFRYALERLRAIVSTHLS
ncbi:MAG: RNA polymerase sigma factor [Verrucomicrobiales bacterium]